jgi:K+-sensing histidine kinase KdpD
MKDSAGFGEETESHFYLSAGPALAIVLGMALVPLRASTSASNLTFVFIVLTIAVGEFGGRWPALATAVASALSLNFFLTQPYLTLAIHRADDVIAFVGLALCGLVAAAFSSDRGRRIARLDESRRHLLVLRGVLARLLPSDALEAQLEQALRVCREALPLSGAVVRDPRGYVLASSDNQATLRPLPEHPLAPAPSHTERAVPEHGARIALALGERRLGWLDVWGDGRPASAETRRTLADLATAIALVLAAAEQE